MLKTLFTRSENSVHLYDGLFLFPVATKRLPHTAALLDLIVVRIDTTTVTGLNNKLYMPIIHKKHIRDLCAERKNVTLSKPCVCLL